MKKLMQAYINQRERNYTSKAKNKKKLRNKEKVNELK